METLIRTAFQPIMSDRGHIVAYEALLRFREGLDKPESREIAIKRWEDTGYIGTVDVSVLKQAIDALDLLHNSLLVSVTVTLIAIFVGSLAAYALARIQFPFRSGILMGIQIHMQPDPTPHVHQLS